MMKSVLSVLIIVLMLSFNSFAAEEEEAQTRPKPLMHQKMVSKGKNVSKTTACPKLTAGQLKKEDEDAQTMPKPDAVNKKMMVPDEEEEEAGMVAPASAY